MSEALLEILSLAALSPSSHNTQPWVVTISGSELLIGYDTDRQLKVGDPNKRELFISLGCFIETIGLSANSLGYDVDWKFVGSSPRQVVRLSLEKSKKQRSDWIKLIRKRRSDRRFYESRPIPEEQLSGLRKIEQDGYGASLLIFERPEDINFLAKMSQQATHAIMSEQAFREELASWVRNNWTNKPDGMPGYTQGMPGPISLLAKFVIKKTKKVASDQAKKDAKRVAKSSAVGLICVEKENPESWIEAGRLYQAVCLSALRHDIKTSAVSAAVIFRPTVKEIVNKLKLSHKPVALMRFGYTKNTVKAAPRLKAPAFTKS